MTPEEKAKLDQIGRAVTDITIELIELRKLIVPAEVTMIGKAAATEWSVSKKISYLLTVKDTVQEWGVHSIDLKIAIAECITKIIKGDE